MRKPANIVFSVDEPPPRDVLIASGLQHIGLLTTFLVYPVVIGGVANLDRSSVLHLVSMSLLALGIATILQAQRRGPIGSGYLCPALCSSAYAVPSLLAVKVGGLALVGGMTVFAGAMEILFGRMQHRLRPYFPPEIGGLVVILLAVNLGKLGTSLVLGVNAGGGAKPPWPHFAVAFMTLAMMVGLNVWARGRARMLCALIGMIFGYIGAQLAGLLKGSDVDQVLAAPLLALPLGNHAGWTFDPTLAVPFAVAALAAGFNVIGVVTTSQRINDAGWEHPDMRNIGRGIMADGTGSIVAGLLGTVGIGVSSGAVGLAAATGVTSRAVAYAVGAMFIALAFLPKAAAVIAAMPHAVMGAVLMFSAAFVLLNGIQIIASRLLDARRTFVVGLSFALGLTADFFHASYAGLPAAIAPLASSSLVLGLLCALLLNLVFRVGVWNIGKLRVEPGHVDSHRLTEFIEATGASWGARRDMIERVRFNVAQSVETIAGTAAARGPIDIEAAFDGYRIDVRIAFDGPPLELPQTRPSEQEILESADGMNRLAGYLLRRLADRVRSAHRGGRTVLEFQFDH